MLLVQLLINIFLSGISSGPLRAGWVLVSFLQREVPCAGSCGHSVLSAGTEAPKSSAQCSESFRVNLRCTPLGEALHSHTASKSIFHCR